MAKIGGKWPECQRLQSRDDNLVRDLVRRQTVRVDHDMATNNFIKWNKGLLNYRFDNSGDMKKYSGLKIYTDLEGRIIRVNKYLNGKKTTGIFVPRYASPDDKVLLHAFLKEQFKNMHFQYGIRIAPPTRSSEDDNSWSYRDWDQDPFDDSHYYAPDDELDGG